MQKKGGVGIIILIILILVVIGAVVYFLFIQESNEDIDLTKLEINTETLIIEQNIGNMNYIETGDDGGEAVFLGNKRTNDQVNKEVETFPLYSGVYKNKKYFPEGNYAWADNRISVMVQDYKETISDSELNILLEAKSIHDSYSEKIVDGKRIYVIDTRAQDLPPIYIWKSLDKLIIIIPSSLEYSEEDVDTLAKAYLGFY